MAYRTCLAIPLPGRASLPVPAHTLPRPPSHYRDVHFYPHTLTLTLALTLTLTSLSLTHTLSLTLAWRCAARLRAWVEPIRVGWRRACMVSLSPSLPGAASPRAAVAGGAHASACLCIDAHARETVGKKRP
eukprot:2838936-Pleurochrysis_carterae.AAC.1